MLPLFRHVARTWQSINHIVIVRALCEQHAQLTLKISFVPSHSISDLGAGSISIETAAFD